MGVCWSACFSVYSFASEWIYLLAIWRYIRSVLLLPLCIKAQHAITYECWHTSVYTTAYANSLMYAGITEWWYYAVMYKWIYAPVSASVITVYVSVVIVTVECFDNHYADGIYTVAVLLWCQMYAFQIWAGGYICLEWIHMFDGITPVQVLRFWWRVHSDGITQVEVYTLCRYYTSDGITPMEAYMG